MVNRFKVLDGWRGVSISFVLAGHLLPLGPKSWQMNAAVAAAGMALFFILSGFLITNMLLKDQNIGSFLIRRFMRIIPLAWLCLLITLISNSSKFETFLPHFLFYANWEPMALTHETSHYWSLCVEMQFYILIAILVSVFKSRAFMLLPILCVAVTANRYLNGVEIAINTYYRIDEILAGCVLALLFNYGDSVKRYISLFNPVYMLPLLLLSAHPAGGVINYLRPYIAMLLIGSTLFKTEMVWWNKWLTNALLVYLASISYALYVIHGGLRFTWLGEGESLLKYAKRPILFATTFLLAHLSTFYYEKYWIDLGKKVTSKSAKHHPD
ncbi:acyltransferase family protein [mine drainage metagenome]|uniref:Acyltransferase family protein n=1 Tax=mine drainage metagenome TaxID=410659 RepID=A0A1J5SSV4_9ZZZZ